MDERDPVYRFITYLTITGTSIYPEARRAHCAMLEETGHKPGACSGAVAAKFWTFQWEYYCAPCREYEWCGTKTRGYMVAR